MCIPISSNIAQLTGYTAGTDMIMAKLYYLNFRIKLLKCNNLVKHNLKRETKQNELLRFGYICKNIETPFKRQQKILDR